MWPIASRVLGGKYGKVTKLKNGILMKTDLKDILGRFVIFYGPYVDHFWEPKTTQLIEKLLRFYISSNILLFYYPNSNHLILSYI